MFQFTTPRNVTINPRSATLIGAGLTALWLLILLLVRIFGSDSDAPASTFARLAGWITALLPLVLIWLAVGFAHAIAALRAEAAMLRAELGQMPPLPVARREAGGSQQSAPSTAPGYAAARPATSAPMPQGTANRAAPARAARPAAPPAAAPAAQGAQPGLPFDAGDAPLDISVADMVLAMNFPDGPGDVEAIRATRRAMTDPDLSRFLRSAQDVVTLLAKDSVYTDELPPVPARPEIWRKFAQGERGRAINGLGGIEDPATIEIVTELMRDPIFRDTAHHFLRQFDRVFARLEPEARDAEIEALAQTRSARAFMVLARVTGMFGAADARG
ncbi:hypothetical protein [Paracoccus pacificus]|uniref:Tellurite resistance protein TerB n=1 Tax=Paracoccus pacificus TaxID=1463598 RepID=A0ABW4RAA1_9RHOB